MSQAKIWTLPGGIHPPENKEQSTQQSIQVIASPEHLVIPVWQHLGKAALPVVAIGDKVLAGQVIATADSGISAAVHSPVSGEVVAIEERPIIHASGQNSLCVVIQNDFNEQWVERHPVADLSTLAESELQSRIAKSGLVGQGGAGFPSALKIISDRVIDTLVINGAECEPYITADDALMREQAERIVKGIAIAQQQLKCQRTLIGIEDNKAEAIAAMQDALKQSQVDAELRVIPTKYPSGGEKQLIYILTGKEVPSAGLPADIGIVCLNVGSCAALYDAVYLDQPVTRRICTVTGELSLHPGNYEVLIGTPIEHVIQQVRQDQEQPDRVIIGGPMMGIDQQSILAPITKTTNCILLPSASELRQPERELPCIRCGHCEQVCPAGLLPQQLLWHSQSGELSKLEEYDLMDCIECGACSFVCPSNIPLVQYYRHSKGEIRSEAAAHAKSERARLRFEARNARLEQEQAEKEAKRQAKAALAAKAQAAKALQQAQAESTGTEPATAATSELEKLQAKVDKAEQRLAEARESNPGQVAALEKAVAKLREQLQSAQNKSTEESALK